MSFPRLLSVLPLVSVLLGCATCHAIATPDVAALLKPYDVLWDNPGASSADSMPIGNGDIGLNVWTEPNGDLLFYIGKTDAWTENPSKSMGLAKVGKVRVSMTPSPFTVTNNFSQTLHLYDGEIVVSGGSGDAKTELRVWVDANAPVIHLSARGASPSSLKVSLEPYRSEPNEELKADYHATGLNDKIAWCHFDGTTNGQGRQTIPEVVNFGFGGLIQGKGLILRESNTLVSAQPSTAHEVSITVASGTAPSDKEWIDQVLHAGMTPLPPSDAKQLAAHREWWHEFWNRSYIFASGTPDAEKVTQGFILQRFVTACSGRGGKPIKFNGSIFVVDDPKISMGKDKATGIETFKSVTADFRSWGGQYWFQNTRAMYWPRLKAGDFDMMKPLFAMYLGEIKNNEATVKKLYNHDGSYVAETSPFWGALPNLAGKTNGAYTDFYFTPVLELSTMMLDYYDYTQDQDFLKNTLLPFANSGLTFFSQHFPKDASGKLLLSPDNSIEMYWMVNNPLPDIAGLHSVLPRLQQLPENLTTPEMRSQWAALAKILPDIPLGEKDGKKVIFPYDPILNANIKSHNMENPEMYAVFPFRLYGLPELGHTDLQVAKDTFAARTQKGRHCWGQDPMQAAMMGLTDTARDLVLFNLTKKDPRYRFLAFWDKGHDYAPDEDNGGNGEQTLQLMLMQTEGKKILLLPAWPKEWNCTFKLHAPYQTTVSGRVENGKVEDLVVDPELRSKDVVVAQ